MNLTFKESFNRDFADLKKVSIIPHRNPDGDAMGSTLGLRELFLKQGVEAKVILPNEVPDFLKWLPGFDTCLNFERQNKQSMRHLTESDLICCLDFNAFHRVGDVFGDVLEGLDKPILVIDHHQSPEISTPYLYSDTSMSSTCEMVFHFGIYMGWESFFDQDFATCLYTGIMTDTGSFKFRSTTSLTHRVVASLIDYGADNAMIHDQVFNQNSVNRLHLLGRSLSKLTVLPDYKVAFIELSKDDLKEFDFQKGDTEGVVNYALSIKGIVMAAIFIEDENQGIIKISFRSRGDYSVNDFSRGFFNGGGHINAAGGRSTDDLENTIKRFKKILVEGEGLKISESNV